MDVGYQILRYLLLIAAGQGLALSLLVVSQGSQNRSFSFLTLFFLLISLGCAETAIEGIFFPIKGEELPFPMAMPLAYLPAIYIHLLLLFDPSRKLTGWASLHFLPAFVLDFAAFFLVEAQGNISGLEIIKGPDALRIFSQFYEVFFFAHYFGYTLLLIGLSKRESARAKPSDKLKLAWTKQLIPVLTVFWSSWVIIMVIGKGNPVGYTLSYFVHGSAMALIYWFGYRFLFHLKNPFYRSLNTTNLNEDDGKAIIEKIEELEVYRTKGITIAEAAKLLGCSQKSLSLAVNSQKNLNFNEYINDLRIKAFTRLAEHSDFKNLSQYGIAQEVGFASKASFHRSFKKSFGKTPNEYLAANS